MDLQFQGGVFDANMFVDTLKYFFTEVNEEAL